MKNVVCINDDFGVTKCTKTFEVIEGTPGPKLHEILLQIDIKKFEGIPCYSFEEYNTLDETNWFECANFADASELIDDIEKALKSNTPKKMSHVGDAFGYMFPKPIEFIEKL